MYYTGDKIKENEMDWACGSHGGNEKRIQNFGGEIGRKKTTWKV
jgi:hypothetical protein